MLRAILVAWILAASAYAAQTVDGHVVNSVTGADVPGVVVRLRPVGEQPESLRSATTDSQGRFRLEGVPDGAYTARYGAPGFWPLPNVLGGSGQPFPVASGGDPVHLEVKIQPIPRISGRVLDAGGKPVPNATLWMLWESKGCVMPACFPFFHQSKSGPTGEFTMGDPDAPGTWLLSAAAPSSWKSPEPRDGQQFGWAQTYYPAVSDPQLAARLIVQAGGDLANLEIKLAAVPVHRIRGKVLDARGDPVAKASLELAKSFGPSLDQATGEDGTFEFPAVTDDEWRLSTTVEREGVKLRTFQSLRVQGRDLDDIRLRLTPPLSIQGKIVMEVPAGAVAPDPPPVMMAFNAGGGPVTDASRMLIGEPGETGDVTIHNVYPGPYQILPGPPPAGYYLDSIRFGGRDALANDVPILSDALPITVTYKPGGGTVRGTVEDCGAGRVLLIPQEPVLRRGPFVRMVSCGQYGRFEFPAVRPGEYYGLAIGADGPIQWYAVLLNDVLMSQAGKVTVRANESTSTEIRLSRWQ